MMRGDGKKRSRVRRGSMSEGLGGGEGGLSPLDARERGKTFACAGVQCLRTWAEERAGSACLMRGDGKRRSRGKGFDALRSLAEEKADMERGW